MSDSKWRRLFDTLSARKGLVLECVAILVWDDTPRDLRIDGAAYEFDYWQSAVEGLLGGAPRGWYSYREFYFLEFPALTESGHGQDVDAIRETLEHAGRFDVETTEHALRVYAYRE